MFSESQWEGTENFQQTSELLYIVASNRVITTQKRTITIIWALKNSIKTFGLLYIEVLNHIITAQRRPSTNFFSNQT